MIDSVLSADFRYRAIRRIKNHLCTYAAPNTVLHQPYLNRQCFECQVLDGRTYNLPQASDVKLCVRKEHAWIFCSQVAPEQLHVQDSRPVILQSRLEKNDFWQTLFLRSKFTFVTYSLSSCLTLFCLQLMDLYLAGVSASVKFNNPIVYIR